jgi:hypothetical protein
VCVRVCARARPSACLSVCLSVCLPACPPVCLSACLSVCVCPSGQTPPSARCGVRVVPCYGHEWWWRRLNLPTFVDISINFVFAVGATPPTTLPQPTTTTAAAATTTSSCCVWPSPPRFFSSSYRFHPSSVSILIVCENTPNVESLFAPTVRTAICICE